MTISDAGFIASGVMLATAIMDAVRGRSGLGRHRLTKLGTPDRFWMAVVLYFNMAFFLFWVSGKAYQAEAEAALAEGSPRIVVYMEDEAP